MTYLRDMSYLGYPLKAPYGRHEEGENMWVSSLLKILKALDVTPEEFWERGKRVVVKSKQRLQSSNQSATKTSNT